MNIESYDWQSAIQKNPSSPITAHLREIGGTYELDVRYKVRTLECGTLFRFPYWNGEDFATYAARFIGVARDRIQNHRAKIIKKIAID